MAGDPSHRRYRARMTSSSASRAVIITGTGSAYPSRLVTNAELGTMLGHEVAAQLAERFGPTQRYWCGPEESTADLVEEAARSAMGAAGVAAADVGLLVVATDTPEFVTPPTSAVVHGRLELTRAHAIDVSAGGADFVSALEFAWNALRCDARIGHALVIGVSAMSRYLDTHDARTVATYGDGAGAVVLSAIEGVGAGDGVLATTCRTMGQHSHDVGVFAGGTRTPITSVVLDAGLQNKLRVLREYPEALPDAWAHVVRDTLAHSPCSVADVHHWIWAHPSRAAVLQAAAPFAEQVAVDAAPSPLLSEIGYAGAATLPMTLDDAVRHGRVADGDVLLLTSAGAGVAMGAVALRWTARASA